MINLSLLLHGYLKAQTPIETQRLCGLILEHFENSVRDLARKLHRRIRENVGVETLEEVTNKAMQAAKIAIDQYRSSLDGPRCEQGLREFVVRYVESGLEGVAAQCIEIESARAAQCVCRPHPSVIPSTFVLPTEFTAESKLPRAAPILLPELRSSPNGHYNNQSYILGVLRRVLWYVPGPRFEHKEVIKILLELGIYKKPRLCKEFLRRCIEDSICIKLSGSTVDGTAVYLWNYQRIIDRINGVVDSVIPTKPVVYPSAAYVMRSYATLWICTRI